MTPPYQGAGGPQRPPAPPAPLQIVGHCQVCGCPIYGAVRIFPGEVPVSVPSCTCFSGKSFLDTVRTT